MTISSLKLEHEVITLSKCPRTINNARWSLKYGSRSYAWKTFQTKNNWRRLNFGDIQVFKKTYLGQHRLTLQTQKEKAKFKTCQT